jgi:DNA polymerase-3 subunit alpha/error-prone DNA polymerase
MKKMANFWRQGGETWPAPSSSFATGNGLSEALLAIISQARRLSGTPRYISVHPGGVILTRGPVSDYVPVQLAAKGVPIIQWEKEAAEESGLIKIDILGNRSLGVVRDALLEAGLNGRPVEEFSWRPEEDPATQELVAKGQTMGCFYIESPAMRLLQKKAGKGDFAHLVIHSSIIRPAANEYIREYIRRLHGGSWNSAHPLMDEVLAESYGIMAYQEDVSRIAVRLAGFSHTEADRLRKIISKKDRQAQLSDFKDGFLQGCARNGLAGDKAEEIWRMMLSFSGYSFCKPHSASYAKVSFQAAYLKRHFPAEFMAAVLNNGGGFYSVFAYVSEARRLGLRIVQPRINTAAGKWLGKGERLRVGLLAIKGLSRTSIAHILAARGERQFDSIADFCRRVQPPVDEARMLLYAGAFDELSSESRSVQLWELLYHLRTPRKTFLTGTDTCLPLPLLPELSRADILRQEFISLGFLCDSHPLSQVREGRKTSPTRAAQLPRLIGRRVELAGWLITGKLISTKTGAPMEFITFEDETSLFETIFFPRVYKKYGHLLESNRPFQLVGKVEEDYGAVTMTVEGLERLA